MYHLAQINIARMVAPLDDPRMREFVENLTTINALAEASPGFVWRWQSDLSGNATDLAYNEDPLVIANMSVWESVESLRAFTYQTQHVQFFRKRAQWFEKPSQPGYALWWIPAGRVPTIEEGKERLELYRTNGATSEAFWFSQPFAAPVATEVPA